MRSANQFNERRLGLAALVALFLTAPAVSGVKYGDAAPGVIRPSDLEAIKRALSLDRFSVIAAVRLGAEEGREAIIAEPLPDETLRKVKEACEGGGFCPDPAGFVAWRVRIVRLLAGGVGTVVVVGKEARGGQGRLIDLRELGVEGEIVGWSGGADAFDGHVALSLTPITNGDDGRTGAGLDPPLLVRFNPETSRFQVFDCVAEDGEEPICAFQEEPGD